MLRTGSRGIARGIARRLAGLRCSAVVGRKKVPRDAPRVSTSAAPSLRRPARIVDPGSPRPQEITRQVERNLEKRKETEGAAAAAAVAVTKPAITNRLQVPDLS